MGFFGTYLYDGKHWSDHDPDQPIALPDPWLMVTIHDSDFTIVTYQPRYDGTGVAYLGHTPRMYFEDENAHPRTDTTVEATALITWSTNHGTAPQTKRAELLAYLAEDLDNFDTFDEDVEGDDDLPDSEVFVELKTANFLTALSLPVPPALERSAQ